MLVFCLDIYEYVFFARSFSLTHSYMYIQPKVRETWRATDISWRDVHVIMNKHRSYSTRTKKLIRGQKTISLDE